MLERPLKLLVLGRQRDPPQPEKIRFSVSNDRNAEKSDAQFKTAYHLERQTKCELPSHGLKRRLGRLQMSCMEANTVCVQGL